MKRFIYYTLLVFSTLALFAGCSNSDEVESTPDLTVTFDSQGGSAVTPITVEQGSKINRPTDPTYEGFTFMGWFKEKTHITAWNFQQDVVEADITLYAKWTALSETFTVTFETNGGSTIAPVRVTGGEPVAKPTDPTKTGFTFENWYTNTTLTTVYDFSTPVTANLTLYAKWQAAAGNERQGLLDLLNQTRTIRAGDYTVDSYAALSAAQAAAEVVLENVNATTAEILTAHAALQAAFEGLVSAYDNNVVGLVITSPYLIDGIVYVAPSQWISIQVYGVNAAGEPVADEFSGATFEYDATQLEKWGTVKTGPNDFQLIVGERALETGTSPLKIISASKTSVSKTVTLKVAADGELKQIYLDMVAALPQPAAVGYDDFAAIQKASNTYYALTTAEQEEPAVAAAQEKVMACWQAHAALPNRLQFSAFTGNICTLTDIRPGYNIVYGEFTYTADGTFPAGVFMHNNAYNYNGSYMQYRFTIQGDNSGKIEYRDVADATGANPGEWRLEQNISVVRIDGAQSEGGIIFFNSIW